ncbi:MAG: VWA domain-containing protein [Vicinamibacterales bacterium]
MALRVAAAPQQPTFRTRTSVVLVDVLVRDGSRPVRGLQKADFQVFDEGFPQQIDELLPEQMPIDLTILLDASGSTAGAIESFKTSAAKVSGMLRPEDRVRVMAFATGPVELMRLTADPGPQFFAAPLPTGATSLNDALVLTLARARYPGRRHLVVAYTDGADTASVLDTVMVARVARRSDAVLHLVLAADGPRSPADALRLLREAAESTGGGVSESSKDAAVTLRQVFDDFRESYVLRYTPADVSSTGWHSIAVRVTRPDADRYTVRARKGYSAGGGS